MDMYEPNQATSDVIEFLTNPDLDLGANLIDIELLQYPLALKAAVAELLDTPAVARGLRHAAPNLASRLHDVDWPAVSDEFRARIQTASRCFDDDAETVRQASSDAA